MSKYTTEVRFICENYAGLSASVGYAKVDEVVQKAIPKIFDFDWPIFDEAYRNVLSSKILKHFYTREIGVETVALWKFRLQVKLNEIMPFYNQLYKSALLEFNPLYDVDYTRKYDKDASGNKNRNVSVNENSKNDSVVDSTSNDKTDSVTNETDSRTSSSENSNVSRDLYSDTPQGALTGVESEEYLTNARKITASGDSTGNESGNRDATVGVTGSSTGKVTTDGSGSRKTDSSETLNMDSTEDYLESVKGKQGGKSYSELLVEYRKTFINVDLMVIEELDELFMQVW